MSPHEIRSAFAKGKKPYFQTESVYDRGPDGRISHMLGFPVLVNPFDRLPPVEKPRSRWGNVLETNPKLYEGEGVTLSCEVTATDLKNYHLKNFSKD